MYAENMELQGKAKILIYELEEAKLTYRRHKEMYTVKIQDVIVEIRDFDYSNKRKSKKLYYEINELRKENKELSTKIRKLIMGIYLLVAVYVYSLVQLDEVFLLWAK